MLDKIETPILILVFIYLLILTLVLTTAMLLFISTTGIINYVKHQKRILSTQHCRIYLEQNQPTAYEGCVKKALVYYDKKQK